MTATATASVRADARLGFGGVLRSEWIKFTSLRSTYWTTGIIIALWLGLTLIAAASGMSTPIGPDGQALPMTDDLLQYNLVSFGTFGVMVGVLVAAIQGVLAISGEYSTGMIRSSLTAVPGRLSMYAGKAVVVFVWMFLIGAVSTLGSYLVALPFLAADGVEATLDGPVLLAYLGAAVYLGLVALFGLGIGTLVRAGAGGIAIVVGVLLVLPTLILALTFAAEWLGDVLPYVLSQSGAAMSNIEGNPAFGELEYGPGVATLIMAAWSGVALLIGAVALKGRDA